MFLDFDLVLNTQEHLIAQYTAASPADMRHLQESKVELVNALIEETGADVVVTSAWRFGRPPQALQQHMEAHGFKGKVVGVTPHIGGPRGAEIQMWLDHEAQSGRPVDLFAILDDDCNAIHLDKFLVRVDPREGLTEADGERALKLLTLRSDLERFMRGHNDVDHNVLRDEMRIMSRALNGLLRDLISVCTGTEELAEEYVTKTSEHEFMRGFYLGKGRGYQAAMNAMGHLVNKAQLVGFRGVDG